MGTDLYSNRPQAIWWEIIKVAQNHTQRIWQILTYFCPGHFIKHKSLFLMSALLFDQRIGESRHGFAGGHSYCKTIYCHRPWPPTPFGFYGLLWNSAKFSSLNKSLDMMSSFSTRYFLTLIMFSTTSVKSQNISMNNSLDQYFGDNGTDNWSYESKFCKFKYVYT